MPTSSAVVRRAWGAIVAIASLATTACGDPFAAVPTLVTIADTTTVYALNGTPSAAPSALNLFDAVRVRADVTFQYDMVFDLDANNRVVVIPVRRMTTVGGGFQVGMQTVAGSYSALLEAPASGYHNDSTFVVDVGQVIAIQSANPVVCGPYSTSPYHYAKVVATKVDPVLRTILLSFTVDRNCGFRSFDEGVPER